MAQAKARAMLQTESMKAYNNLVDQWEDLRKSNEDAMDSAFWGGLIGSIGLPLLATLTGPVGAVAVGALAGAGSYFGSEIGEHHTKGLDFSGPGVQGGEAIQKTGLRADMRKDLTDTAETMQQSHEDQQLASAATSAISGYTLAGGALPGTEAWGELGGVGDFMTQPGLPAFGGPGGWGTNLWQSTGGRLFQPGGYFNPGSAYGPGIEQAARRGLGWKDTTFKLSMNPGQSNYITDYYARGRAF